jgi:NUMOD3 motif-containing protein
MFYTYLWFRENSLPYYVGKGKGDRAFVSDGHGVHRPKDKARILIQNWESEEKAFEMEKWWIAFYGRKDLGTGCLRNLTDGGEGPSGFSESIRSKMSTSQKAAFAAGRIHGMLGKRHTEESKQKNAEAHRGKKHTKETCHKMSNSRKGHETSEAVRSKISASNMGHGFTPETLEKMRKAKLGRSLSEEHKQALREASKSRPPISEETRQRLRAAAILREQIKSSKKL